MVGQERGGSCWKGHSATVYKTGNITKMAQKWFPIQWCHETSSLDKCCAWIQPTCQPTRQPTNQGNLSVCTCPHAQTATLFQRLNVGS